MQTMQNIHIHSHECFKTLLTIGLFIVKINNDDTRVRHSVRVLSCIVSVALLGVLPLDAAGAEIIRQILFVDMCR